MTSKTVPDSKLTWYEDRQRPEMEKTNFGKGWPDLITEQKNMKISGFQTIYPTKS
jgi:hypothetical protein